MRVAKPTEAGFLKTVLQCARLNGWLSFHVRPGLTKRGRWVTAVAGDGVGFLDCVLVRERVVWVELKVPPNKLTSDQRVWVEALRRAGQEVWIWTPADWPAIERTLA